MNNDTLHESSILSEWWKQIDKWLLISLLILMISGFLISLTINPTSIYINNIGILSIFSIQHIYLIIGLLISIGISMLRINHLKKMILPLFIISFLLLFLTLLIGQEWNGSKRWINLNYFTIMPIEFIKPFFMLLFLIERLKLLMSLSKSLLFLLTSLSIHIGLAYFGVPPSFASFSK